jgi:hypothetical protein
MSYQQNLITLWLPGEGVHEDFLAEGQTNLPLMYTTATHQPC